MLALMTALVYSQPTFDGRPDEAVQIAIHLLDAVNTVKIDEGRWKNLRSL
jgi:hypothetical protein